MISLEAIYSDRSV